MDEKTCQNEIARLKAENKALRQFKDETLWRIEKEDIDAEIDYCDYLDPKKLTASDRQRIFDHLVKNELIDRNISWPAISEVLQALIEHAVVELGLATDKK